mgnify:CR=1 FL=1
MRLVKDARDAWKWHSTQIMAALTVVPLVWVELPEDLKVFIPETWRPWILSAVALGGIIGRVRQQGDDS